MLLESNQPEDIGSTYFFLSFAPKLMTCNPSSDLIRWENPRSTKVPTGGICIKLFSSINARNSGNEKLDIYLMTSRLRGTIPEVTIVQPSKTFALNQISECRTKYIGVNTLVVA